MVRKVSTPSSLTFEESDKNGTLMRNIFENLEEIPDKETTPEQTSTKKYKSSSRDSLTKPDEEIDLHGKTRDEAIKIVQKFVFDCYQKNLRSALIITGKGHNSAKKGPVLKREVKLWLERNGETYITDFYEAPPRFGGSGAIWLNFR